MRFPALPRSRVLAWAFAAGLGTSLLAAEPKAEAPPRPVPRDAYVLFTKGVALEMDGQYAEAIQHFEKALTLDPKSSTILYEIGYCYSRAGKNAEAVDYLKRSLAIEPGNGPAHETLAHTYQVLGRRDEAVRELETAAKSAIRPRNHEGLVGRIAWIYERQGDLRKAIEWYRYYVDCGYRKRDTLLLFGTLQLKERLYEDAFETFRHVVRLTPSEEASAGDVARAYADLADKDRTEAIRRTEPAAAKAADSAGFEVLAMLYRAAGRRDDMVRALERAAAGSSRRAATQKEFLAEYCEELGDFARAIEWRRKLLEEQKKPSAESYALLGRLYAKNEQMAEAVAAYRQALAADLLRTELLRRIAGCYSGLHQWGQAAAVLEEYRKGKTLGPADAEVIYDLGELYHYAGKADLAAAAKQKAFDLLTKTHDEKVPDAKVYLALAGLYYADGKPDKALGCILVVQNLDPEDSKRLLLVGSAYKRVQNWRQAAATFRQFLDRDARSNAAVSAFLELAYCQEALGLFDEATAARELARKLLLNVYKTTEQAKTRAALQVELGEIEVRRSQFRAAIEHFQAAARDNPNQPLFPLFLAECCEQLADWLTAASHYKSYLAPLEPKLRDDDARHLFRLGVAQTRSGQVQTGRESKARAIALLTSTLETLEKEKRGTPAHKAEIHRHLAGFYAAEKLYDKALEALQLALALAPPSKIASYRLALASVYDDLKRYGDSEKTLLETHKENPTDPAVLNHLGYFYAERGKNLDQAVELVKKALCYEPLNGAYIDSLGWAYYQQGKNQDALDLLLRAARYEPDAVILDHVGDAYFRLGRVQEARDSWLLALRHDPDLPGVAEKLKRAESQAPTPPQPAPPPKAPDTPQPKGPSL